MLVELRKGDWEVGLRHHSHYQDPIPSRSFLPPVTYLLESVARVSRIAAGASSP